MTRPPPSARTSALRFRKPLVIGLVAVLAAIVVALGHPLLKTSPTPSSNSAATPGQDSSPLLPAPSLSDRPPSHAPHRESRGALDETDGVVPDGATVLDDAVPAVANLDAELLDALRRAARDAAADGVTFTVNSGWRSAAYQEELLRKAIAQYGSEAEAARWVATATTSPHVSGDAVDIGPDRATDWLSQHGSAYGLCRIYRNEPWHFELRTDAADRGCPRMYADPTQDPRMRQ
ncbi:M15 family metallopeptidase [Streptomyces filamentosus]|uniref:M15 family metallopeptidase n=1 Tax=Streptomyces filamentosus TaxID=67294 RepID=A0ABY4UMG1_STRFL|nr:MULTISPECIES: D-alanyl-D-alanine carboxypeptidase family protein [Streptomyces]ESU51371.1 peptidase M15B and M15C, D,D-carboxypeptidase VanY [Streptomyces sp. HCCB10043]USC45289.1 M15 family metallopeptidase [Streptomyces filamentosus]